MGKKSTFYPFYVLTWVLSEMLALPLYKTETMEEVMAIQNKVIYIRDLVKQIEEN